jgi:hypothetical protein
MGANLLNRAFSYFEPLITHILGQTGAVVVPGSLVTHQCLIFLRLNNYICLQLAEPAYSSLIRTACLLGARHVPPLPSPLYNAQVLSILFNLMRKAGAPSPSPRHHSGSQVVLRLRKSLSPSVSWQAGARVKRFHRSNTSWGISFCQL